MFWIKSRKLSQVCFLFSALLIFGCTSEVKDEVEVQTKSNELTEEELMIRQVENSLGITAAEKYDIQIEYKYINADTLQDALILVNRAEHAFQRAKNNDTERFFENTGYTAPHNHIFVKLGGVKKLLSTVAIGSNVKYPLEATFLELTSKAHQDFYVDYRIRNSMQRDYFTVRRNNIYKTFSCPVFDSVGVENPRVYDIQHRESSVRIAKDIALYHGEFEDYEPSEIEDVNNYTPKGIIGTDKLFVYFIFDDRTMKYKTPMGVAQEE